MTFEEFDKVCEQMFQEVRVMRDTKGKEYARSKDRFDNFNRLAKELKVSRELILWVYTSKHLDGIVSYVNNGRTYSEERIHGRIKDVITYLLLLDGMVVENDAQGQISLEESKPLGFGSQTNHPFVQRDCWAEGVPSPEASRFPPQCHWYTSRGRCILLAHHIEDHRNDIS